MQVYRGLPESADTPVALTIGNFDGVHRGHHAMLSRLLEAAEDLALPAAVLTFNPHPREFFAPDSAPPRLSTVRSKLEAFAACGVERTYIARFDGRMAALSPATFIDQVLVRQLRTQWVLVGEDFRFGKARAGDLALLRANASTFSVEAMRTVAVADERASSTAVRAALADGNMERARGLLGHPYRITGRVAHGAKLGRDLGFPTANIVLRQRPPLTGIFAVRIFGLGDTPRLGAASVGFRPTVTDDGPALLEVFIFDFDQSIYGTRLCIDFMHKLRDEARFPDLTALRRQIAQDVDDVRAFFAMKDQSSVGPTPIK